MRNQQRGSVRPTDRLNDTPRASTGVTGCGKPRLGLRKWPSSGKVVNEGYHIIYGSEACPQAGRSKIIRCGGAKGPRELNKYLNY